MIPTPAEVQRIVTEKVNTGWTGKVEVNMQDGAILTVNQKPSRRDKHRRKHVESR